MVRARRPHAAIPAELRAPLPVPSPASIAGQSAGSGSAPSGEAAKPEPVPFPEQLAGFEHVETGAGLFMVKLPIALLREQDVNARMMPPEMFRQLVANIRRRGTLESMPFCAWVAEPAPAHVEIVSGHHRARAAKEAGLQEIAVLLESYIDLAALPEYSDVELERIAGPAVDLQWKRVTFTWLPHQMDEFDAMVHLLDGQHDLVGVAPMEVYEPFRAMLAQVQRFHDVRSVGTAIVLMVRAAQKELDAAIAAVNRDEGGEDV